MRVPFLLAVLLALIASALLDLRLYPVAAGVSYLLIWWRMRR